MLDPFTIELLTDNGFNPPNQPLSRSQLTQTPKPTTILPKDGAVNEVSEKIPTTKTPQFLPTFQPRKQTKKSRRKQKNARKSKMNKTTKTTGSMRPTSKLPEFLPTVAPRPRKKDRSILGRKTHHGNENIKSSMKINKKVRN